MQKDPVLEEIWRIKDEQAARFGYDVRKLAQALQEEEQKGDRKVVSFPPRRIEANPPKSWGTARQWASVRKCRGQLDHIVADREQ